MLICPCCHLHPDDCLFKKAPLSSDEDQVPLEQLIPPESIVIPPPEPFPTKFRLRRIEPLDKNVEADSASYVYTGVEFEPTPEKKYMFTVEVGDVPPKQVFDILNQARKALKAFVPEGSLVVPCRNGHPAVGIYEITKVE